MRRSGAFLTVWLLSCARATGSPEDGGQRPEPDRVSEGSAAADAGADPGVDAGSSTAPDPAPGVPCSSQPRPGDRCDTAASEQCFTANCGARNLLECAGGAWQLVGLDWQGASSPFDFQCAPEDEAATDYCQNHVQCCGLPLAEASGCPIEGGCGLCPAEEPVEGTPCSLPSACDGYEGPRVLDCFYPCCCYGEATWAQCDGSTWHLNTNCTPK